MTTTLISPLAILTSPVYAPTITGRNAAQPFTTTTMDRFEQLNTGSGLLCSDSNDQTGGVFRPLPQQIREHHFVVQDLDTNIHGSIETQEQGALIPQSISDQLQQMHFAKKLIPHIFDTQTNYHELSLHAFLRVVELVFGLIIDDPTQLNHLTQMAKDYFHTIAQSSGAQDKDLPVIFKHQVAAFIMANEDMLAGLDLQNPSLQTERQILIAIIEQAKIFTPKDTNTPKYVRNSLHSLAVKALTPGREIETQEYLRAKPSLSQQYAKLFVDSYPRHEEVRRDSRPEAKLHKMLREIDPNMVRKMIAPFITDPDDED